MRQCGDEAKRGLINASTVPYLIEQGAARHGEKDFDFEIRILRRRQKNKKQRVTRQRREAFRPEQFLRRQRHRPRLCSPRYARAGLCPLLDQTGGTAGEHTRPGPSFGESTLHGAADQRIVASPSQGLGDFGENSLGIHGVADAQGLQDHFHCRHGIALQCQRFRQTVQTLAILRQDDGQPPIDRNSLGKSPLRFEYRAQIAERLGVIRHQRQGPADARLGLIALTQFKKRRAKIVKRFGEIRLQRQRLAIAGHRLARLPAIKQNRAEIVMRLCLLRLERQRLPIADLSLLQHIKLAKRGAEIAVRPRQARLERDCTAITGYGVIQAPGLVIPHRLCK
ncbi:MAG TPA: hypothetical protein VGM68_12560 [Rhizomicrobium sp.]